MALATIIAGRYSSTLQLPSGSALDLGIMEKPGYKLMFTPVWELVDNTDGFAAQPIEGIWQGFSLVGVDFVSKEYKQGPLNAAVGWASAFAPTGANNFSSGLVGRRAMDLGGTLVLSATASTPAASTPASLTSAIVSIREGYSVEWLFDSSQRKAPCGLRFWPTTDGAGGAKYFSTT